MTNEEIEAGRSKNGGFTREQLAKWGVGWPPKRGWEKKLLRDGLDGRKPLPYREKPMTQPAWSYVDQAEQDRLAMKKLYQEKSGDYSY